MGEFRVLEVKQSIFADNDRRADEMRAELKKKKLFLLNLTSSPGPGKTTTLTRTIKSLSHRFKSGVMQADIEPRSTFHDIKLPFIEKQVKAKNCKMFKLWCIGG